MFIQINEVRKSTRAQERKLQRLKIKIIMIDDFDCAALKESCVGTLNKFALHQYMKAKLMKLKKEIEGVKCKSHWSTAIVE